MGTLLNGQGGKRKRKEWYGLRISYAVLKIQGPLTPTDPTATWLNLYDRFVLIACTVVSTFLSLSVTLSTFKAPITTAADDFQKYFFIVFSEKIRFDVSSESSARQRIHMKNQALFFFRKIKVKH